MRALVVCKHSEGSEEANVCRLIRKEGFDVKYSWKNTLKPKDLDGIDIVISIGGDGTALSASHFLTKSPLLAVNSDPEHSEGALTTMTLDKLDEKLEEIKSGKYKTEKLERIEVSINGKLQNILALNEVFIANEKAYHISKYKIKFNGTEEEQRSSGLIFSTGAGSTGWFKSARGGPFPVNSKYIKMHVREPYIRNLMKFSILDKTIYEKDEMIVMPLTNMVLAIDSIREIKLKKEDKVKIKISDKPLLRIA
jgi:NAD+ kinase